MWRVVLLFWVFLAPVVAGVLVITALMIPALAADLGRWIVIAAVVGAVVAVPVSVYFAKTQAHLSA